MGGSTFPSGSAELSSWRRRRVRCTRPEHLYAPEADAGAQPAREVIQNTSICSSAKVDLGHLQRGDGALELADAFGQSATRRLLGERIDICGLHCFVMRGRSTMLQSLAKNVKKPISIDILLVDNNKSGAAGGSGGGGGDVHEIYDFPY